MAKRPGAIAGAVIFVTPTLRKVCAALPIYGTMML
jgi:hypothetical protein